MSAIKNQPGKADFLLVEESFCFFKRCQIVGFAFAIPFFECSQASSRDDHGDHASGGWVDQAFFLKIWVKCALGFDV